MIEKHTFTTLLHIMEDYSDNLSKLENTLGCTFDNNWLDNHVSTIMNNLTWAFFDKETFDGIAANYFDKNFSKQHEQYEKIEQLIFFFCYDGNWGAEKEELTNIYTRANCDPVSIYNTNDLYDVIIDYITHPDDTVTFSFDERFL